MAKKRVQIEEFMALYLKAHDEGMTREEFAEKIGLKSATVYQRIYELRREVEGIPLLKSKSRMTNTDKVKEIMEEYLGKKPTKKQPASSKVTAVPVEESDPLADILR